MRVFGKPVIDITAQIELLKQRGLQIQDEARARCSNGISTGVAPRPVLADNGVISKMKKPRNRAAFSYVRFSLYSGKAYAIT